MASFLSGLMGGLKSIGSGVGGAANGLMSTLSGTPASAAAAPGSGGLMSAASLVGPEGFDWGRAAEMPPPQPVVSAAPKKGLGGFLDKINTPGEKTGLSFTERLGRFGATLQDIDQGGDRADRYDTLAQGRLNDTKSQAAKQAMAAQINALFPDDPRMQFLLKAAPDKAAGALADVYKSKNEAYTLGQGQKRGAAGEQIDYAPEVGVDGGFGYSTTPEGRVDWGTQRGRNWAETEAERSHREDEKLGAGRLGIAEGQLGIARGQLGVAQGHLGIARDAAGRAAGGAPAGGLSAMSTADLIAALRGGR